MYDPSSQFEENVPPTSAEDPYTTPQSVPSLKPKSSQFTSIRPSPQSMGSPGVPIERASSLTPNSFRAVLGNQENRPLTPLDPQDQSQVVMTEVGEAFRAQVLAECAAASGFPDQMLQQSFSADPMPVFLAAPVDTFVAPQESLAPEVDVSESFRQQVLAACAMPQPMSPTIQSATPSVPADMFAESVAPLTPSVPTLAAIASPHPVLEVQAPELTVSPWGKIRLTPISVAPERPPLSPLRRGESEIITSPMSPVRDAVRMFESSGASRPLSPTDFKRSKLVSPFNAGPPLAPLDPTPRLQKSFTVSPGKMATPVNKPQSPVVIRAVTPITASTPRLVASILVEDAAPGEESAVVGIEDAAVMEDDRATEKGELSTSARDTQEEPALATDGRQEEPALATDGGQVEPAVATDGRQDEPAVATDGPALASDGADQQTEAITTEPARPESPVEGRAAAVRAITVQAAGSVGSAEDFQSLQPEKTEQSVEAQNNHPMHNSHASAGSLPSLQPLTTDQDKSRLPMSAHDSPRSGKKKKSAFCFCC